MDANNKELRWISYDTDWSKDLEIPNHTLSPFAPAVEAYKDLLYCLHQDTVNNPELWWNIYDKKNTQWKGDNAVVDVLGNKMPTIGAPAVTHANDFLYCVHHRDSTDSCLWWSRFNTEGPGTGWSQQALLKDAQGKVVRSAKSATVTVYDGLLYCVHDNGNGLLKWITHNTKETTWSSDQMVPGNIQATRTPAIERFKDRLYCVHDRDGDYLYWITYDSKTQKWSDDQRIEDRKGNPVRTTHTPAITRYKDYLYCVYYVGEDSGLGKLWWTRYNIDAGWSIPERVGYAISSPGIDIAAYDGPLYCVHRG